MRKIGLLFFLVCFAIVITPSMGQGLDLDDFGGAEESSEGLDSGDWESTEEDSTDWESTEEDSTEWETVEEEDSNKWETVEEEDSNKWETVDPGEEEKTDPANEEKKEVANQNWRGISDEPSVYDSPVGLNEDRGTVQIVLSGALGFRYIFREDLFADAVLGNQSNGLDGDFFDPQIILNLEIQLAKNVSGVIELHNESRVNQLIRTSLGTLHITNRSDEDDNFQFEFEKAYIRVDNFLLDNLTLKAGIIPQSYSLRANGEAFFLDLGEAESPFGEIEDTNARGIHFSFQPTKALELYVDGFYFTTSETGFNRQDESIAGLNFDLYLSKTVKGDDGSTHELGRFFNLILAAISGDSNQPIWSVGFGVDYFLSDAPENYLIELYAESLFQVGQFGRKGRAPNFANRNQSHLAFGGYAGARYSYEASEWKPFVDVSFWYISGDDDDPNSSKNRDLVTYENIDSTLIVEENDYGFDIDSNYWAVKFKSGISLEPLFDEQVKLEVLYAHFEAVDEAGGKSGRIGDEVDLRVIWEYSPDLTFSLAAGLLFNSKFLKEVFDEVGVDGDQNVFLLRLEMLLRF